MDRFRSIVSRTFPWALALTLTATAFAPDALNASIVSMGGLLLGGLFALAGAVTSRRRLDAPTASVVVLVLASCVWFAFTSTLSASPAISFVGAAGQHVGTALWVLGAAWLVAGILCTDRPSLVPVLAVVSVAGAVFGAAALREALTSGAARAQGFAAGFFENSTSLGEFLGVAVVAAAAWGSGTRNAAVRAAAVVCIAVSFVAMFVASARTGLLGVLAAAGFAAIVALARPSERKAATLGAAVPVAAGVATAIVTAASFGTLGPLALRLVNVAGTDRDVLWRSAFAQFRQAPVIGAGLEQFSAWVAWTVNGGNAAYDPHNAVLAIADGAGVVGVVLVGVSAGALVWALVRRTDAEHRSIPLSLAAAVPVALLAEGLVAWLSPASMLAAAAVAGVVLGGPPPQERASRSRRRTARDGSAGPAESPRVPDGAVRVAAGSIAIGALTLGVVFAAVYPTLADYIGKQTTMAPEALASDYERWRDPVIGQVALREAAVQARSGDAAAVALTTRLLAETGDDARWRVDTAASRLFAVRVLSDNDPASFAQLVTVAEAGRHADPTSGLWDTALAMDADRLGLHAQAVVYAKRALAFPLPPDALSIVRRLASG